MQPDAGQPTSAEQRRDSVGALVRDRHDVPADPPRCGHQDQRQREQPRRPGPLPRPGGRLGAGDVAPDRGQDVRSSGLEDRHATSCPTRVRGRDGYATAMTDERNEAIQAVVDRVSSYQDGAPEGTVEKELRDGFTEAGVDVERRRGHGARRRDRGRARRGVGRATSWADERARRRDGRRARQALRGARGRRGGARAPLRLPPPLRDRRPHARRGGRPAPRGRARRPRRPDRARAGRPQRPGGAVDLPGRRGVRRRLLRDLQGARAGSARRARRRAAAPLRGADEGGPAHRTARRATRRRPGSA